MKLTNLGRNSALKIRKEIITDLEDKGYKLDINNYSDVMKRMFDKYRELSKNII